MVKSKLIKGYVFVVASAVIYGLMPLMAKLVYAQGVNPISLVFLRNFLCLPALAVLAWCQYKTLRVPAKLLPKISVMGLLGCCLTPLLLFASYIYIASGTATVFHFIYPAVVVSIQILFLRKRVKPLNLISVIICVVGIALFYTPGTALDIRGAATALLSGITFAIYVVMLGNFNEPKVSGFLFSLYVSGIACVAVLAVCILSSQLMLPTNLKGWALSLLFSLSITGAVVLFQQGTFIIGGERSSVLSTMEPLTSLVVGVAILGERIGFAAVIGAVLVLTASTLSAIAGIKEKE